MACVVKDHAATSMLTREEDGQPAHGGGESQQHCKAFISGTGKPVHLERLLQWDELSLPKQY